MTTPDPTLTPAQMLELLARYVDVQQRLERAGRTQEVYTLENSPQLLQMRINALDPATLRAHAAALAERESQPLLALYDMDNQDFGQHRILDVGYDPTALVMRKFPEAVAGDWYYDQGDPDMWFSKCGRYGISPAYVVPALQGADHAPLAQ